MWTKRRDVAVKRLGVWAGGPGPTITTTAYTRQQQDSAALAALEVADDDFNFIASLDYALVPHVSPAEARGLLPWVMARWLQPSPTAAAGGTDMDDRVAALAADAEVCAALSQVEYFFIGTDNGHLYAVPMVPSHFTRAVASRHAAAFPALAAAVTAAAAAAAQGGGLPPVNCGLRRLLHRHIREELVVALGHCGTLVATAASADRAVALSMFHPRAVPIALVPHTKPVRCLKLWEGGHLENAGAGAGGTGDDKGKDKESDDRRRWRGAVARQEPRAVYLFTGEESDPVVRLFRVDVVAGTFCLLHVFAVAPNCTGVRGPLDLLERDGPPTGGAGAAVVETERSVHCLAIDGDARLLAGLEGGVCVWALDQLPYTAAVEGEEEEGWEAASRHPLSWDPAQTCPLAGALAATDDTTAAAVAAARAVRRRAARLVNQHVWVCEAAALRRRLELPADAAVAAKKARSPWKPKYAGAIAGGAALGVVSNEVALAGPEGVPLAVLYQGTVVTLTFDGGEVRNDVSLPLACVRPAVYPLAWMPMAGNACFALAVLKPLERIVTSGSDGRVAVWFWSPADAAYLPRLVAGRAHREHRGIGRHVCVLREPDVFLSCGYDDGVVREWHVYDEPERLLRCERRFTMRPGGDALGGGGGAPGRLKELADAMTGKAKENKSSSSSSDDEGHGDEDEDCGNLANGGFDGVAGISSAVALPAFGAMFLVGVFEPTIQTFSLAEVQGCEAPPDYIYNGYKTLKIPSLPTS